MKQEFFGLLGEELYQMKNSPFLKIGEQAVMKNESGKFGRASGLSYDPDRLFNK